MATSPPALFMKTRLNHVAGPRDRPSGFAPQRVVVRVRVRLGWVRVMVAPVAYQVILEPGIGQFREFESPLV